MREKRSGKGENFRMGRNFVTGIPGIVPQEGINRSGIEKKFKGKVGFYEAGRVNSEECGKVIHLGFKEEK